MLLKSRCLLLSVAALAGCGRTATAVAPRGGHFIFCEGGMKDCVLEADRICAEEGYTIVSGASLSGRSEVNGSAQRGRGRLEIRCGRALVRQAPCYGRPERSDTSTEGLSSGDAAPTADSACVPGMTTACVGAGACAGGRICLADGNAYGPCDCGDPNENFSAPSSEKVPPVVPVLPGQPPVAIPLGQEQ